MGISTHVLDTALGRPATGVPVTLEERHGPDWLVLGEDRTDADGRARALVPEGRALEPGTFRLRFQVDEYFAATRRESFYPFVEVVFRVRDAAAHHHVPLLLAPYGYSTYRGS